MTYRKNTISKPPFGGWNDGAPSAILNATSFRQITNWMIRYNRITPFFQTGEWFLQPALGTRVLMAARTWTDAQGFIHTSFLTNTGWGELIPGNPYSAVFHDWGPDYPQYTDADLFSLVVYNGQLFFANGVIQLSYFIGDGNVYAAGPPSPPAASNPVLPPSANPAQVADFPGTCYFLAAFADRLLAINTIEPTVLFPGATNFPTRIRYSAVNNALEWDATIDESAGVFQISDAEDALTGAVVVNQTLFVWRKNGITAISATGNEAIPFFVENFSVGPDGVGCFVPYTLSAYGTVAGFVAQDDVYVFSGGAPTPIGTNAKRSIFKDLANASSTVHARMVGSFGGFVDYLTYWLAIPLQNDTITSLWIYHFDDQQWINTQWPYEALRSTGTIATV